MSAVVEDSVAMFAVAIIESCNMCTAGVYNCHRRAVPQSSGMAAGFRTTASERKTQSSTGYTEGSHSQEHDQSSHPAPVFEKCPHLGVFRFWWVRSMDVNRYRHE